MSDDYYHRRREEDYYHREREHDYYRRQREHDFYRRKRDRDREANLRERLPSAKAPYSPFAAALRVAVLVAALWLICTVLSLSPQIAYEWWQTVFVVAALIVLVGIAKELVLCLIRLFSNGLSAIFPLISGALVGLAAASALHAAGIMSMVAAVLANAPPA